MSGRAPYTPAKLYVDGIPELSVGDFLRSNGGSLYLVQALRPSPSKPRRRYLETLRWPPAELPDGATVHAFHWYKR